VKSTALLTEDNRCVEPTRRIVFVNRVDARQAAIEESAVHEKSAAIYRRPQSDQLFCFFTGGAAMLNINPLDFIQKTGVGHTNIIIFRDPYKVGYRRGISANCPTLDAIVSWVKTQLVGPLSHVRQVLCAGTSGGGVAAIYLGYHLAARAVWSLGGRIAPPNVGLEREKLADEVFQRVLGRTRPCLLTKEDWRKLRHALAQPDLANRVRELTRPDLINDPAQMAELLDLLGQNDGRTEFHFYYAPTNRVDRAFAETFRRCAFVTLHEVTRPSKDSEDEADPFNDPDHLVVPMLDACGQLDSLFARYVMQPT
jgi:hypothetical protein